MEWKEFLNIKNMDAYRRLFAEMLLYTFNDILSKAWYEYFTIKVLNNNDKKAQKKLEKHNEAIEWLCDDSNGMRNLCLECLGMHNMRRDVMLKAISRKFNSPKKFHKFFKSYAGNSKLRNQKEIFEKNKRELYDSKPKEEPKASECEEFDWLAEELERAVREREKKHKRKV